MNTLTPLGPNASAYHTAEYYREAPGLWMGRGAAALGLTGPVEQAAFEKLFHGFSADGRIAFTMNAGSENRRPGWDMTANAPKGISLLQGLGSESVRRAIEESQWRAVRETVGYLEAEAAYTRVGKNGIAQPPVSLVVAAFPHSVNRLAEPHSHTHLVILNIGVRDDGTTGAILSKALYQHKMAAGLVYRSELAYELQQRLGLELAVRDQGLFELKGIPKSILDAFSGRRQQIVQALEQTGYSSPRAASVAALTTRPNKEVLSRQELVARWEEKAASLGLGRKQIDELLHRQQPSLELPTPEAVVKRVVQRDESRSAQELLRRLGQEGVGHLSGRGMAMALREAKTLARETPHREPAYKLTCEQAEDEPEQEYDL